MTPRGHSVTGHEHAAITAWQVAATPPGAVEDPAALERAGLSFVTAAAPTTAAAAARAAGWSLDAPPRRFDAEDWWFRARLPRIEGPATPEDEFALVLDGLATVADVWLDGAPLLSSANMFVRHERALRVASGGELVVRCRSLVALLAA